MTILRYVSKCALNYVRPTIKSRAMSSKTKESLIELNSQKVNYLKVGHGNKNILCCPGALGTIWKDFRPQIEGLSKNEFTIIAWDPPGHGGSTPLDRELTTNFLEEDADTAYNFIQKLGLKHFSILGWSDGGITGMILASKYPQVVEKLVIWGAASRVLPEEMEIYENIRDLKNWSEKAKAPLLEEFGEETAQKMQNKWCDVYQAIFQKGGDICDSHLENIKCPTLILHGNKDVLIAPEQPEFLAKRIVGSKLYRFPEGKHNIHIRYAKEFNEIVTDFLLN